MAADETIVIDLDASGVERGAARVESSMTRVGASAAKAGTQATSGLRPTAEALAQINRVSQASSGSLAAVAESMGALARGAKEGHGQLLLAASGLAVAAAAAVGLASAAVSAASDIEDLSDSLSTSDRRALAPYIQTLRRTRDALDDAGDAATRAKIKWGAFASDVVEGGSKVAEAVYDALGGLVATNDPFAAASAEADARLAAYEKLIGPRKAATQEQIDQYAAENAAAKEARAEAERDRKSAADKAEAARIAERQRQAAAEIEIQSFLWDSMLEHDRAVAAQKAEAEAAEIKQSQERFASYAEWRKEQAAAIAAAEIKASQDAAAASEAAAEAERMAQQQRVSDTSTALSATASLLSSFADFQSFMMEQTNQDNKAALRQQFAAQKAVMIAQALAGAALAIVQGFSQLGPIGGAVTAATTTLATGLQIAKIAAAEPSFHVGGTFAPDERMTIARTRDNELGAFFTAQAMDRLGGPQAAQDIAQTGRTRERDGDTYLVLNGEQFIARQFAKPDPRLGHRRRR